MLPKGTHVIIVPDDDALAVEIPPGILAMLTQENILMSNDSLRMYVRHTKWERMKESFVLTNPGVVVDVEKIRFRG